MSNTEAELLKAAIEAHAKALQVKRAVQEPETDAAEETAQARERREE